MRAESYDVNYEVPDAMRRDFDKEGRARISRLHGVTYGWCEEDWGVRTWPPLCFVRCQLVLPVLHSECLWVYWVWAESLPVIAGGRLVWPGSRGRLANRIHWIEPASRGLPGSISEMSKKGEWPLLSLDDGGHELIQLQKTGVNRERLLYWMRQRELEEA